MFLVFIFTTAAVRRLAVLPYMHQLLLCSYWLKMLVFAPHATMLNFYASYSCSFSWVPQAEHHLLLRMRAHVLCFICVLCFQVWTN